MKRTDFEMLAAEEGFISKSLSKVSGTSLMGMNLATRLSSVRTRLERASVDREPFATKLTFSGRPVSGSFGIDAEFGTTAVRAFTEAVVTLAASMSRPLATMGPIPDRESNRLLITRAVRGSFGFELVESQPGLLGEHVPSAVAMAVERAQGILSATLGSDEDLAEQATETDPRALDKLRSFLQVLSDSGAACALTYGGTTFRFDSPLQVAASLTKLGTDNIRESLETLTGHFTGALPDARTFEFQLTSDGSVVRGKVGPNVVNPDAINDHRVVPITIRVVATRVGNGRPRYVLNELPLWPGRATTAP